MDFSGAQTASCLDLAELYADTLNSSGVAPSKKIFDNIQQVNHFIIMGNISDAEKRSSGADACRGNAMTLSLSLFIEYTFVLGLPEFASPSIVE